MTKPGEYKRGDVVLVSFPYTTDEGTILSRRRPGVIVSNDYNNARLDDVLVVPLTSNTSHAQSGKASNCMVIVMMNSPEGQQAGLRLDSVIDCTVIATIPKALLVSKIGQFPPETISRVDDCIRNSIDPDDKIGSGVRLKAPDPEDDTGVALPLPEPESKDDEAPH